MLRPPATRSATCSYGGVVRCRAAGLITPVRRRGDDSSRDHSTPAGRAANARAGSSLALVAAARRLGRLVRGLHRAHLLRHRRGGGLLPPPPPRGLCAP